MGSLDRLFQKNILRHISDELFLYLFARKGRFPPNRTPQGLNPLSILSLFSLAFCPFIRNCAKVRRIYASKLTFSGAYVMARRQQSKLRAGKLTASEGVDLLYYRAHIREACQNDHVIYLECGFTFKSLPQHLGKHHLTGAEYKAKIGPLLLLQGITWRGLRRRALAMNLAAYSPPHSLRKALKARRGRRSPYRPEQRLAQIDAARSRMAVGL